jgi:hypothetical protein
MTSSGLSKTLLGFVFALSLSILANMTSNCRCANDWQFVNNLFRVAAISACR